MVKLLAIPNDPTSAFRRNDEEDFLSEFNPKDINGKRYFDSVAFLNWKDETTQEQYGVKSYPILNNKTKAHNLLMKLTSNEMKFSSPLFKPIFLEEKDEILKKAREYNPDLIRAYNTHFAAELGHIVADELNIPLIVSAYDPSRLTSAIKYADSLVCESNELKQKSSREWRINPEKIAVIHNPIDMEVFHPQSNKDLENTMPPEWINSQYKLLSISRLVYGKNIEGLLEAISMIKSEFPGLIHYHFGVGSKEKVEEIESFKKNLGLMGTSFFYGGIKKADLPKYYSSADAFILPTFWEGLSRSVREALSCGTPAITTNYGSTAEIVQDGYNGIGINPRDSNDIARGIHDYFSNSKLKNHLNSNARASVVHKYDAVSSMRMHCDNYDFVLSRGKK